MNIDLLERQVETDQNRLEKGEINLTDLGTIRIISCRS